MPNPCYYVVIRHAEYKTHFDFLAGPFAAREEAELWVVPCRAVAHRHELCRLLTRETAANIPVNERENCDVQVEEFGGDRGFGMLNDLLCIKSEGASSSLALASLDQFFGHSSASLMAHHLCRNLTSGFREQRLRLSAVLFRQQAALPEDANQIGDHVQLLIFGQLREQVCKFCAAGVGSHVLFAPLRGEALREQGFPCASGGFGSGCSHHLPLGDLDVVRGVLAGNNFGANIAQIAVHDDLVAALAVGHIDQGANGTGVTACTEAQADGAHRGGNPSQRFAGSGGNAEKGVAGRAGVGRILGSHWRSPFLLVVSGWSVLKTPSSHALLSTFNYTLERIFMSMGKSLFGWPAPLSILFWDQGFQIFGTNQPNAPKLRGFEPSRLDHRLHPTLGHLQQLGGIFGRYIFAHAYSLSHLVKSNIYFAPFIRISVSVQQVPQVIKNIVMPIMRTGLGILLGRLSSDLMRSICRRRVYDISRLRDSVTRVFIVMVAQPELNLNGEVLCQQ